MLEICSNHGYSVQDILESSDSTSTELETKDVENLMQQYNIQEIPTITKIAIAELYLAFSVFWNPTYVVENLQQILLSEVSQTQELPLIATLLLQLQLPKATLDELVKKYIATRHTSRNCKCTPPISSWSVFLASIPNFRNNKPPTWKFLESSASAREPPQKQQIYEEIVNPFAKQSSTSASMENLSQIIIPSVPTSFEFYRNDCYLPGIREIKYLQQCPIETRLYILCNLLFTAITTQKKLDGRIQTVLQTIAELLYVPWSAISQIQCNLATILKSTVQQVSEEDKSTTSGANRWWKIGIGAAVSFLQYNS